MWLTRSFTLDINNGEKKLDTFVFTCWIIVIICNCIILAMGSENMRKVQLFYQETNSEQVSVRFDSIILPCVICGVTLTCGIYYGIKIYINTGIRNRFTVTVLSGLSILLVLFDVSVILFELVSSVLSINSVPEM